jgi:hypothetical protein
MPGAEITSYKPGLITMPNWITFRIADNTPRAPAKCMLRALVHRDLRTLAFIPVTEYFRFLQSG